MGGTVEYPTFDEIMDNGKDQTPTEQVLVQAVAALSTEPSYRHMTPDEVYAVIVRRTRAVHG